MSLWPVCYKVAACKCTRGRQHCGAAHLNIVGKFTFAKEIETGVLTLFVTVFGIKRI